jgi:hypothetical protein
MPAMQLQWPDYARLQVDDTVFCHDPARPYWLWEGVVVSVEPPAVGIYLPHLDTVVFPQFERLHDDTPEPDARCRYCQAVAGAWTG